VRDRILDAALALLREGGIQRVTQVQVAGRAKVRQSHLTYYFPTRHDLLEATTLSFVDTLAAGLDKLVGDGAVSAVGDLLSGLASAVAEDSHMRMFVGLIVEADEDPALRAILVRSTLRLEEALAQALGDGAQPDRARALLAAVWGIGLYGFFIRPAVRSNPARLLLPWLETALGPRRNPR